MAERQQNVIVGIFSLLGVVVLGILVMAFGGGSRLFASTYEVSIHFPAGVFGVQEGQRVTLNGKRIGETRDVLFWDPKDVSQGVRVVVAVDAEYALPTKSEVEVAASIMGFGRPTISWVVTDLTDKTALRRDGSGEVLGKMVPLLDQVLPPKMQNTLERATQNIGEFARALTPVAEQLTRLLEARDIKEVDVGTLAANLDTVVQRFDAMLRNANALFGDPQTQSDLRDILANFRLMSEKGVVIAEDLQVVAGDGKQTVRDIGDFARRMIGVTDELSKVLRQMDQALASLNAGQGTAGLVLKDNRLYEELLLTARRLTKVMDEFREVLDMAKKGKLRIRAL